MKRDVERCLDSALVPEAAIAMRDRAVGFLPVSDETGAALGVLTDRDIVVRVLAAARVPDRTRVVDVMTHEVISCSADDELSIAEDLMIRFQKSRIVCTDAQRRIVGVISLSDIANVGEQGHAGYVAAAIATRETAAWALEPRADAAEMPCRDVMQVGVECCRRADDVPKVAALMRDIATGFVPVCDESGAVIGTITDRDLVVRVVAERRFPATTRADDLLTPELVFCSPDDPLRVAEELMVQHKKSRILCADMRRWPVGVISLSDLARVEGSATVTRVLRGVSMRKRQAFV